MVKKKKKKSPSEQEPPISNGECSGLATSTNTKPEIAHPKPPDNQHFHPKFLEAQARFSSVIKQSLENNEYLSSSEEEDLDNDALDNIMGKMVIPILKFPYNFIGPMFLISFARDFFSSL